MMRVFSVCHRQICFFWNFFKYFDGIKIDQNLIYHLKVRHEKYFDNVSETPAVFTENGIFKFQTVHNQITIKSLRTLKASKKGFNSHKIFTTLRFLRHHYFLRSGREFIIESYCKFLFT